MRVNLQRGKKRKRNGPEHLPELPENVEFRGEQNARAAASFKDSPPWEESRHRPIQAPNAFQRFLSAPISVTRGAQQPQCALMAHEDCEHQKRL